MKMEIATQLTSFPEAIAKATAIAVHVPDDFFRGING
jgi:hypothetical protein